MGLQGVIGSGEAGDTVEQDDDIFAVFDQAFCFFDDHFGDLGVTLRRLIKS